MLSPEERLWAGDGALLNGGPYSWNFTDFDQRRTFKVTFAPAGPPQRLSHEELEATEDVCQKQIERHIDALGPGVYGIRFSDPDGPITESRDPEDDVTMYANCHPFSALQLPFPVKTIALSSLIELDRLGGQINPVSYKSAPSVAEDSKETKAVFKYWFLLNGMFRTYLELSSWSRLPRDHPHIVPFDAVVIDHVRGGVVGFTTRFIPGGDLYHTNATKRPFRLEWLRQLLSVIDDLNYLYGIMHQDIAPRNIVIDERDTLRLLDFNYAIMIDKHYTPDRDDTNGAVFTLYEVLTLDQHYREVPHPQQDHNALLSGEWTKHPDVRLDSDIADFRVMLSKWVAKRSTTPFKKAATWIEWPFMPALNPLAEVAKYGPDGNRNNTEIIPTPALFRQQMKELNQAFYDWERKARCKMPKVAPNESEKPLAAVELQQARASEDTNGVP